MEDSRIYPFLVCSASGREEDKRALTNCHNEELKELKELNNQLKDDRRKYEKLLSTIEDLMKRIADSESKRQKMERMNEALKADLQAFKRHRFGSFSQKCKIEHPAKNETPDSQETSAQ